MSGAGRSTAADALEDVGFFVIDNLPPALIGKVADLARSGERVTRYVLVVDVRSGLFVDDLTASLAELKASGAVTRVVFLDASDDVLVRRYEATRRRHPLAEGERVVDGILKERRLLEELKGRADIVLDTTGDSATLADILEAAERDNAAVLSLFAPPEPTPVWGGEPRHLVQAPIDEPAHKVGNVRNGRERKGA